MRLAYIVRPTRLVSVIDRHIPVRYCDVAVVLMVYDVHEVLESIAMHRRVLKIIVRYIQMYHLMD